MSEAVTVPSLTLLTSTVSEESLARDTHTDTHRNTHRHTDTHTHIHAGTPLKTQGLHYLDVEQSEQFISYE